MLPDISDHALAQNHQNPGFGDDRLLVDFSIRALPDDAQTATAGRPIYRDAEFIKIIIPGSRDTIEREVQEHDKRRFPKQWLAFKAGGDQVSASGTPLSAWPLVTRSQVEEFVHFGVKTVEQLAGMSDTNLQGFMGGQGLRQRARDFMEAAAGAAPLVAVRAELEKRDAEVASLRAMIEEQGKIVAEMTKTKK
jgi:hypothetical protein